MKLCPKCGRVMKVQKNVQIGDAKKEVVAGYTKFKVPQKLDIYTCPSCKHVEQCESK